MTFVGCGAVRRFGEHSCEMKRILLDTLPSMASAHGLYRSLGFVPISPYRHNPVPGATFWMRTLR